MHTSCKHVKLDNPITIEPWVFDCINRHKKRHDFVRLLKRTAGETLHEKAYTIACMAVEQIKNRELIFPDAHIRKKYDSTCRKERQIGCESPMNQIFDYIAMHAAMPIFLRRIVDEQCSSIPRRGQIYGAHLIKKYIEADKTERRHALKRGVAPDVRMKYFVKLDIQKCYPTCNTDIFMEKFSKDCGSEDIVWLWGELLRRQKVEGNEGLMIGSVLSQWAAQYLISFIYRFARTQGRPRRTKFVGAITHMVIFMDDMLLTARNRTQLYKAVKRIIWYTKEFIGWDINPLFHIREFEKFNIDMMGYVFHPNGAVTIRPRDYLKARRQLLRCEKGMNLPQAMRIVSYNGFFVHSDCDTAKMKYKQPKKLRRAKNIISKYAKGDGVDGHH